jgi:membrane-associated phospholipid phosphatase
MVIARDPDTPKWLKVTACSVATAVSLSRSGGQKHFPSDIFTGSVLGGLIGNYVATHSGGF